MVEQEFMGTEGLHSPNKTVIVIDALSRNHTNSFVALSGVVKAKWYSLDFQLTIIHVPDL
jgi:hypothetical protein